MTEPVQLFEETFAGDRVSPLRWVDHYLPHWSTPAASAAHYDLTEDGLVLRIDADQPAWRPDESELRVSSLQTGAYAGPVGSVVGQHRHAPGLTVRTAVATSRLFLPRTGQVEATLRASLDPTTMLAFWLVGFEEDDVTRAGEICVVELFGHAVGRQQSELSIGVKAHHDPGLRDDMAMVPVELDATAWHIYAAEWDAHHTRFLVDGEVVRTVEQGVDYPMQVMLGLFEFPPAGARDPSRYPKLGWVRSVRGRSS